VSAIGHNSDDVLTQAAQTRLRTIADTTRSLKRGDRVRVTREQTVDDMPWKDCDTFVVNFKDGPLAASDDPTIISIEVIERPLQVGDRVTVEGFDEQGAITAIGKHYSLVELDCRAEVPAMHDDLRRAS